jgi:hypothetical protein
MSMKHEMITALSDSELAQVMSWVQAEQKAREGKRKTEAIAKIKELAQSVGVSVNFEGRPGRPKSSRATSTKN